MGRWAEEIGYIVNMCIWMLTPVLDVFCCLVQKCGDQSLVCDVNLYGVFFLHQVLASRQKERKRLGEWKTTCYTYMVLCLSRTIDACAT